MEQIDTKQTLNMNNKIENALSDNVKELEESVSKILESSLKEQTQDVSKSLSENENTSETASENTKILSDIIVEDTLASKDSNETIIAVTENENNVGIDKECEQLKSTLDLISKDHKEITSKAVENENIGNDKECGQPVSTPGDLISKDREEITSKAAENKNIGNNEQTNEEETEDMDMDDEDIFFIVDSVSDEEDAEMNDCNKNKNTNETDYQHNNSVDISKLTKRQRKRHQLKLRRKEKQKQMQEEMKRNSNFDLKSLQKGKSIIGNKLRKNQNLKKTKGQNSQYLLNNVQRRKLKNAARYVNKFSDTLDMKIDTRSNGTLLDFEGKSGFIVNPRAIQTQSCYRRDNVNPWNKSKRLNRNNQKGSLNTNSTSEDHFNSKPNYGPSSSRNTFNNSYNYRESFTRDGNEELRANFNSGSNDHPYPQEYSDEELHNFEYEHEYKDSFQKEMNDYPQDGSASNNPNQKRRTGASAMRRLKQLLKMAIVHKSFRNGDKITNQQFSLFSSHIMVLIASIPSGDFVPSFETTKLNNDGAIRIICSNEGSRNWLLQNIKFVKPWSGADLTVIQEAHIKNPKLSSGSMWIPNISENPYEVLDLLQKQNPGLQTNHWKVFHHKIVDDKGQLIIVGINKESIPALQERDFRPYWNLTRLTIKMKDKTLRAS